MRVFQLITALLVGIQPFDGSNWQTVASAQQLSSHTVYLQKPITRYQLVYKNTMEKRTVTTYRPVWGTTTVSYTHLTLPTILLV